MRDPNPDRVKLAVTIQFLSTIFELRKSNRVTLRKSVEQ